MVSLMLWARALKTCLCALGPVPAVGHPLRDLGKPRLRQALLTHMYLPMTWLYKCILNSEHVWTSACLQAPPHTHVYWCAHTHTGAHIPQTAWGELELVM